MGFCVLLFLNLILVLELSTITFLHRKLRIYFKEARLRSLKQLDHPQDKPSVTMKMKYGLIKMAPFTILVGIFLAVLLSTLWIVKYGESVFLEFEDDEVGILVAQFSGADVTDIYGEHGLREKLLDELNNSFIQVATDKIVIQPTNKSFTSFRDAGEWQNELSAKVLIWGTVDRLVDSMFVKLRFEGLPVLTLQAPYPTDNQLKMVYAPEQFVRLPLKGYSKTLESFTKIAVLSVLINYFLLQTQYQDALNAVERSVQLVGDSTITNRLYYHVIKSHCLKNLGMIEEQLANEKELNNLLMENIEELETLMPNWPPFLSLSFGSIGYCQLKVKDTSDAITSFHSSILHDSTNTESWEFLASTYWKLEHYDSAIIVSKLGLDAGCVSQTLLRVTGICYNNLHENDSAYKYIYQYVEGEGFDPSLFRLLTLVAINLNWCDSILKHAEIYRSSGNTLDRTILFHLERCKIELGHYDKDLSNINSLVEGDSCFALLYFELAKRLETIGDSARSKMVDREFFYRKRALMEECAKDLRYNVGFFLKEATERFMEIER